MCYAEFMIKPYATVAAGYTVYSDVEFMNFPAGEAHFKIGSAANEQTPSHIIITGTDANDFMRAGLWIDYAHQHGHKVSAVIPYLPAARADRGEPFGAKVYANMINALEADRVICFDPHSPVITTLVNNLTVIDPAEPLAKWLGHFDQHYDGIIAPDAGAVNRATKAAKAFGLPVYKAGKKRDFETGKLTGFHCEELPVGGRYLVVDDICDGGGTFRGLAAATGLPKENLDLWVSHGVFSGAAGELKNHFGQIFTTDSHPGHTNPEVNARILPIASIIPTYL